MTDIESIKKAIEKQSEPILETIKKEDYLSSGSTLINLACSSTPYGAFAKGKFFWMVGESSSGKTWLTLNALAEAAINPHFKEYDLIYNNVEDGALMDVKKYFGSKLLERLRAPEYKNGEPHYSRFTEEWYYHLDSRLTLVEKGKAPPFIELLDSLDSLTTKYEGEKFQEGKKAFEKGTKATGDYGDGKAKLNSKYLRDIVGRLRSSGSILIVLSQERDNVGGGLFDPENTVAGGRALKFYATWQLWSSLGRSLSKEINGTKRKIGITSRITVKKNRLTGKEWVVEVPIYWSVGIDEVGSLVDFLVDEKKWVKDGPIIKATDFDFEGSASKLIRKIEDEELELDLRQLVTETWKEIEEECEVVRKPRYT